MATLVTWDEFTSGGRPQGGTIRELVLEQVANLISKRRPAMTVLGDESVSNTYVESLEDEFDSRGDNAVIEGAAWTDPTLQQPTRNFFHVQRFAKWGQVSDEQRQVAHYGMQDPFSYQGQKKLTELLNDIEHALHRGSAATGATSAARRFNGLLNIPDSTTSRATYTSSSGTTFTEEILVDYLQVFRDNNFDVVPTIAFVASYLKRTISEFSTRVTRNVNAVDRLQMLIIERHASDFGDLDVIYSEDQLNASSKTTQGNSIIFMDPSFLSIGWLQRPTVEQMPRDGFRMRFQMTGQCSLVYRTNKAIGGADGLVSYINQS